MRDWFQRRFIEQDVELLQRVRDFGRRLLFDGRNFLALNELANELAALAEQKVASRKHCVWSGPRRLTSSGKLRSLTLPEPKTPRGEKSVPQTPFQLAVALTILEGQQFLSILPGQCVAYIRRKSDLDAVPFADFSALDTAHETNRNITRWVKKSILQCNQIDDRVKRIKFMCQTATVS
jgi:hypothetical protein